MTELKQVLSFYAWVGNYVHSFVDGEYVPSPIGKDLGQMAKAYLDRMEHRIEEAKLTPREKDVLWLVTDGLTDDEIGRKLFISKETALLHLANIYKKAGVNRRSDLIIWALGG